MAINNSAVNFYSGTNAQFSALSDFEEGSFYYVTDTQKLYLIEGMVPHLIGNNNIRIWEPNEFNTELPTSGVENGDIYYIPSSNTLAIAESYLDNEVPNIRWIQLNPDTNTTYTLGASAGTGTSPNTGAILTFTPSSGQAKDINIEGGTNISIGYTNDTITINGPSLTGYATTTTTDNLQTQINNINNAVNPGMEFKGICTPTALGNKAAAQTPPTVGDSYKISEAGSVTGLNAAGNGTTSISVKIGDLAIWVEYGNNTPKTYTWAIIPAGDETFLDTVRTIKIGETSGSPTTTLQYNSFNPLWIKAGTGILITTQTLENEDADTVMTISAVPTTWQSFPSNS